jgi:hypothetical protein
VHPHGHAALQESHGQRLGGTLDLRVERGRMDEWKDGRIDVNTGRVSDCTQSSRSGPGRDFLLICAAMVINDRQRF